MSYSRLLQPIAGSFFLWGARSTGKSQWLQRHFPEALTFDLLDAAVRGPLIGTPGLFRERVLAQPEERVIVVDEIQKAPGLLDEIHRLIEESGHRRRFVMTGSSLRRLRESGANLLGGRASALHMHPFLASELGADFSVESALREGLIPGVITAPDVGRRLAAYVEEYIATEIAYEARTLKLDAFRRFLEAVSFSHAGEINLLALSRACGVDAKTVGKYIGALTDMLVAFTLPCFAKRASRKLVQREKFYFFDAGVFRRIRPVGKLDAGGDLDGLALEGLVAHHLRAHADYAGGRDRLYFWRTSAGIEVDFILYGETVFRAIEVKNSDAIRPDDLRGLKAFREDYPEAETILLYRGEHRRVIDGITCIPVGEYLLVGSV